MEASVVTPPRPKPPGGTVPPPDKGNGGSGGGGRKPPGNGSLPLGAYRIAIWIGIISITVLFLALTVAMLFRAETSSTWVHTQIPSILYLNTLVLVLSSVTLEVSRRSLHREAAQRFTRWLYVTTALGITFFAGQYLAWRELAAHGIYVTTNPSSSFFYILTAAHGVHLLGGLLALCYLVFRARKLVVNPRKRIAMDVTAIYWHFMDVLWLYVLILLEVKL